MDINYYKSKYEPIAGEWYIKEQLGKGSYGKVFRIEKEDMSGVYSAALKVITVPQSEEEIDKVRNMLQDEGSVTQYFKNLTQKLVSEFKLMAELKGASNIVAYEGHSIHEHDDGIGYDVLIRMELLTPLKNRLESLDEQEIIKLGIDICKALETCQKYNIVHRDIKPENIFYSKHKDYKLGDFGVAKIMENDVSYMTTTGTYIYMAPELKKGEQCGSNVDLYSLGMVMYKLLNHNREPFLPLPPEVFTFEQREQALVNRIKGMPLPKPAQASERLAEILLKACAYDPQNRYQSPLQMKTELENLLFGHRNILKEEPPLPKKLDLVEDVEQETEGIFGTGENSGHNNKKTTKGHGEKSYFDVEYEVGFEENKNTVFDYEVTLNRVRNSDINFRCFDIYVDNELVAENINTDTYVLKLNEGSHDIKFVLSGTDDAFRFIDTLNKFFGVGTVKTELTVSVSGKQMVYYRNNITTGGVDILTSSEIKQKNATVALLLAVFPYTGLFGGYHFYIGDKQGIVRLCTLNFLGIGWVMDIIQAVGTLFIKHK